MRCNLVLSGLMVLAVGAGSAANAAPMQSTFDSDLEGWFSQNDLGQVTNEVAHAPVGGTPDGYAHFVDADDMSMTTLVAPDKFLGDWSAGDGVGKIEFDVKLFSAHSGLDVSVVVASASPLVIAASSVPLPDGPTDWIHVEVPLDSNQWMAPLGGTLSDILPTVDAFGISLDEPPLIAESVGIDNVLVTIPEPASLACLALAAPLFIRRRA